MIMTRTSPGCCEDGMTQGLSRNCVRGALNIETHLLSASLASDPGHHRPGGLFKLLLLAFTTREHLIKQFWAQVRDVQFF